MWPIAEVRGDGLKMTEGDHKAGHDHTEHHDFAALISMYRRNKLSEEAFQGAKAEWCMMATWNL